jgi:3-oxoacyl-(acyl-carrier-protein) synthase
MMSILIQGPLKQVHSRAAGGLEAIMSLKSIMNDIIPPAINYKNPDKECDLDYVPNHSIQAEVNYAISNGFGFGGHNAVLVFKKNKEATSYRAECDESY